MRVAAMMLPALLVSACSGQSGHSGSQAARVAQHDDLSAIQTMQGSARNGKSGAPVNALTVSGTITNTDSTPMQCSASSFVLVDASGNAVLPSAQWCDMPSIQPKQSGFFSATFSTSASDNLQLRFEHPDGTYEAHELIVPPA